MGSEHTFDDVLAANARYADGFRLAGLSGRAGRGLAVVTCIDSRIEPLQMLGLEPGDAKILRNPGGRVTDDAFATLVLTRHLLGVERIMVVAHTNCRMTAADAEELHAAIEAAGGPDTRELGFLVSPDPAAAVREDVERLLASPLLDGVEAGGFVYDVETGLLDRIC
ncbi:MAG TPA: carbonic anhydrase [Gaiellaceae bacterium]|nr:carbonic anhydrase [Gaiellaceae bacterium]